MATTDQTQKKSSSWAWLLWWQIDPSELDDQVTNYKSLSFIKSARGQSVLCLLLSVVITAGMAALSKVVDASAFGDAALFLILAVFIYLGHKWAMIVAMVLWTLEKGLFIVEGIIAVQNAPSSNTYTGSFVMQFIWWCIYMHAFYFAFRVERERKKRTTVTATGASAAA